MQPLKLSSLPLVIVLLFLSLTDTASGNTAQANVQQAYSNGTVKIPTLRKEVMKAESTFYAATPACPASGCPKTSQATRNNNGSTGTLPSVVVELCIAGGVAAVAGGLGLGMGSEEKEVQKKDAGL